MSGQSGKLSINSSSSWADSTSRTIASWMDPLTGPPASSLLSTCHFLQISRLGKMYRSIKKTPSSGTFGRAEPESFISIRYRIFWSPFFFVCYAVNQQGANSTDRDRPASTWGKAHSTKRRPEYCICEAGKVVWLEVHF
jgi:hypothetical protein